MRQVVTLALVVALLLASTASTTTGCTDFEYLDGSCKPLTNCTGTMARYIRIHQKSTLDHADPVNDPYGSSVTISELEVYSNGVNVARAATTTISLSSTLNASTGIANCFDGVRSGSVCATQRANDNGGAHQYLLVDLGSEMPVQSIEIYNSDGSPSSLRLATAELRIENATSGLISAIALDSSAHQLHYYATEYEATAPTAFSDRVCAPQPVCTSEQYASTAGTNVTSRVCDTLTECNGQVRFIRIRNTNTDESVTHSTVVNMREVRVWSNGVNIARESTSTASMSSTWTAGQEADVCIDGDTSTVYNGHICHTLTAADDGGRAQWWMLDLGGLRSIDSVEIFNRNDGIDADQIDERSNRLATAQLILEGLAHEPVHTINLTAAAHQHYDGFTAQFSAPLASTPTQDRNCQNVTLCDNSTQWTSVAATATSDAQCSSLTTCTSSQFESSAPTFQSDRVCTALTVCATNQVELVAPTATSDRQCSAPLCNCLNALSADYKNTLAPDAGKEAYTTIALNTNTWEVEFQIHNVLSMTNGHIIAAPLEARTTVATAVTSLVSSFNTSQLWNPSMCSLGALDTPAASLGVAVDLQTTNTTCYRSFTIKYSLIDAAKRTPHCQLSNIAGNEVLVDCSFEMNTIRAYDLTEPTGFLAKETVFRANITMPRNLPNEVGTLLHASLAKCSVYAAPDFYVDCRIPALWNFATTFTVDQSPSWIIGSSCAQTNGTDATYIRCDLQSISQIYTEATATIGATVFPSGEVMRFNVNYSVPREETATATGALTNFVTSIGTKDGKFFYGNDDLLTLEIEVVDTARLQITQLELFNSDSPSQLYNLRTTPEFELIETQNSTFFVIRFYPARKLDDSNFYRHGPHGVNVSFLFTAARRQEAGEKGTVTYSGLGLKAPTDKRSGAADSSSANASGISQTAIAAVAAGALVAVVAVVAGLVVVSRKRAAVASPTPPDATKEAVAVTIHEDEV